MRRNWNASLFESLERRQLLAVGFQIEMVFDASVNSTVRSLINQAVTTWQSVITGDILDVGAGAWGAAVDDVRINASVITIDGLNGTVAQGRPTYLRSANKLPIAGEIQIDTADISSTLANQTLSPIIKHEICHALGFGTIWDAIGGFTNGSTTDPQYVGQNALDRYRTISGISNALSVPLENTGNTGTFGTHWRESHFNTELMTGYVDPTGNELSAITVGAMQDLGYEVSYSAADSYYIPGSLGSIAGKVWNDLDGSGTQNGSEVGMASTTVYIDANNNGTYEVGEKNTQSNSTGAYSFTSLVPGTYRVRVLTSTGYTQTYPSNNAAQVLTLGFADNRTNINFGIRQQSTATAAIRGTAWTDADLDGVIDSGESGIQARVIYLDADNDGQLDSGEQQTQTDQNGAYSLAGLVAGTYNVRQVLPTGWNQTFPFSNAAQVVTVTTGQIVTGKNFGSIQGTVTGASISGTVWKDTDRDGLLDSNESMLQSRVIYVDADNDGVLDTGERQTTSNSTGLYSFTGLPAGTYRVRQIVPTNWLQSYPASNAAHVVTLTTNQVVTGKNFGSYENVVTGTGSIRGKVWHDVNSNAVLDSGEPGLSGRTVYIDADNDKVLDAGEVTNITDSTGAYAFTNLVAGIYYIRQVLPSEWVQTYPTNNYSQKITLETGVNITQRNFGANGTTNPTTGSIKGTVWNDLDHDGVWDSGEVGISGRTIYIDADNDKVLDSGEVTVTTNSSGLYTLSNLAAGTYYIRQVLPSNWTQSYPTSNASQIITLTTGANITGKDFGAYGTTSTGTGSIKGTVWLDLDQDGNWDSNEVGIAGRTVYIDADNDKVFDSGEVTVLTDSAGLYAFTNLVAGIYYIRQILPSGWTQTYPVSNYSQKITLNTGVNITQRNFGAYGTTNPTTGSIKGTVWNDLDQDGTWDSIEVGISGRTVYIDADNDKALDSGEVTTTTDSAGLYTFSNLAAGTYYIRQVLPSNWSQTSPASNASQIIVLTTGANVTGKNFGAYGTTSTGTGSVKGTVWNDLDHDGVWDTNESGIQNRTVFIDADNDKTFDAGEVTVVTNSAGLYTFSNLVAGLYYIRQILPSGWNQSYPVNNYSQKISLNTGVNITQRNFGTYQFSSTVIDPNGRVFQDENRNGEVDFTEVGASGQTVFADLDNDAILDSNEPRSITNSDGAWVITGLSSTTPVNIRLIVPDLWTQTSPRYNASIIATANSSTSAQLNFGVVAPVTSQRSDILPGESWFDTSGNLIQAHSGSILNHDGTYYWYGENHPFTDPSLDVRHAVGFNVYQSTDLYNWTFLGSALDAAPIGSGSDIELGKVIERPRVAYNESTGKFVMWFHVDEGPDYFYARAGVAVSDSPAGPFTYLGSMRPLGYESRDITLYKDTDGSAYIAFASNYGNQMNRVIRVARLSDDYLTPIVQTSMLFDTTQREAPSIFKKDGRYYMLTSGCDWWNPTAARMHTATSLGGSWTSLGNPATGTMANFTYNSQGTNVLQVTGSAGQPEFVFLADRWNADYLPSSRYVWLPFVWQGDSPKLNEPSVWNRSVFG